MTEAWTLKDQREYAWNYFELHARQRMTVFNYFVLIAALLTAGLAGALKEECDFYILGFVLGLSLLVISFVFWRLDQRVGYLVKHAERVLKNIESGWTNKDGKIDENSALFSAEEENTAKLRADLRKKFPFQSWTCPVTYSECFRLVYIVFGALGVLGTTLSIVRLLN